MAAATSELISFSSTGSAVMLIQPSASGALRWAMACSALTRVGWSGCGVGITGWMGAAAAAGSAGSAGRAMGVSKGLPGTGRGCCSVVSAAGVSSGFAKKSSAAVSTASGTMGRMVGLGAARSGSMPKVPPGPGMKGSMGSLPPSFTSVLSGPRSTSKGARGRDARTRTGVTAGAACGSGWGCAGWSGAPAGLSGACSSSWVTLWPQCSTPDIQSGRPRRKGSSASASSSYSSRSSVSSYSSAASCAACRSARRSARRAAPCSYTATPFACTPPDTSHSHCQTSAGVRSKMYRLTQSASTSMMKFAAGRPQSSRRLPPSTAPSAPPDSHA